MRVVRKPFNNLVGNTNDVENDMKVLEYNNKWLGLKPYRVETKVDDQRLANYFYKLNDAVNARLNKMTRREIRLLRTKSFGEIFNRIIQPENEDNEENDDEENVEKDLVEVRPEPLEISIPRRKDNYYIQFNKFAQKNKFINNKYPKNNFPISNKKLWH